MVAAAVKPNSNFWINENCFRHFFVQLKVCWRRTRLEEPVLKTAPEILFPNKQTYLRLFLVVLDPSLFSVLSWRAWQEWEVINITRLNKHPLHEEARHMGLTFFHLLSYFRVVSVACCSNGFYHSVAWLQGFLYHCTWGHCQIVKLSTQLFCFVFEKVWIKT